MTSILRNRTSKVSDSSNITNKDKFGEEANNDNINDESWKCRHYGWCLPLNTGNDRYSYSKNLHLDNKQDDDNDDDKEKENENVVQFKPWSHYKNKNKFQEMYTDLRLGNRRWWKSRHYSFYHDYFQIIFEYIICLLLSPLLLIIIIIVYGSIFIYFMIPFIKSLLHSLSASFDGKSEIITFDEKHGIKITSKASIIQMNKFSVYRLFHYAYWVTFDLFLTFSRLIAGRQNISLIKDNELIIYMHSNQHLKFEYDSENNIIGGFIDNSDVINIAENELYKGRYFPISKIHHNYKTNIISFTLNDKNKTILSNDNHSCCQSIWNLTKSNYISQRCIMDTLTHSWVHFHFADIVSSQLYKYFGITPKTVLGQLIHSHFIYTSNINTAGAGDQFNQPQISGDLDNCINTLNPVKINPMKKNGAYSILKMRIIKHYYDETGHTNNQQLISPKNSNDINIGHKQLNINQFPPKQVQDRLLLFNDKLHINKYRGYSLYWDMLSEYYESIYIFINKLILNKLININELIGFIEIIDKNGMNGLSSCEPIHVLCTLIWTNGYIHGADHTTYYNIMRNFPHLGVYKKLIINDNHDDNNQWKEYYRSWFASWISFKSQIFIHSFTQPLTSCFGKIADYSSSPKLYNKFKNILYLKKDNGKLLKLINKYHDEYLKDINKVNDKYEWMINVNQLDASISY